MVSLLMRRGSNHLLLRLSASLLALVAVPACKKIIQRLEPAKPPPAVVEAPRLPALPCPCRWPCECPLTVRPACARPTSPDMPQH